jgi:hypothetical protein
VWHGGERFYDWEWIQHHDRSHPAIGDVHDDLLDTQHWWLLIRRNRHIGELAFYRCYAPDAVPLRELVRVAGRRWTIEECFQTGKGIPPASLRVSVANPIDAADRRRCQAECIPSIISQGDTEGFGARHPGPARSPFPANA